MKSLFLFSLLLIVNVFFAQTTTCFAPTNLAIISSTTDSVTLNWTETASATQWEVHVYPANAIGFIEPIGSGMTVVDKPFIKEGLAGAWGCLAFFVRSRCSTGSFSAWTKIYYGCPPEYYQGGLSMPSNEIGKINLDNNLTLYPNPSHSIVQIGLQNTNDSIESIEIYNILGKTIRSLRNTTSNESTIDVTDLSKGIYLVNILTENNLKTIKKLIID